MKLIVPVMLAAVVVMAAQTAEPVAVAFYNVRAGQGIQPLRGHAALFIDGHNCTEASKPRNAWGAGSIQREFDRLNADPHVVAPGLAEAWFCASPENVRKAPAHWSGTGP